MEIILFLVVGFLLVGIIVAGVMALQSAAAAKRARAERDSAVAHAAHLSAEVAALARYRTVVDAEAYAAQLRHAAESHGQQMAAWSQQLRQTTEVQAQAMAADSRTKAAATIQAAEAQAGVIMRGAQERAQQIAGDALVARDNAETYRKAAVAMQNVLEGYGDRYLIPAASLLDDLAAEFGFAEAGQQLKAARARTRAMIGAGSAATCDYVEPQRRATAIAFVLDAFNGKTDSVLADVRHNNYGTLRQKILDAQALVNANGKAFRNARVLDEYVAARLEELQWAVAAHELRQRAKEEQRVLKERIREEERAQKEFEKAMREAQKEEDMLRKAMEKARQELSGASAAQKERYEAKLRELSDKLQLAEAKNQRALSMAQQTRTGHVYVISNIGSFGENVYKIGMTRRLEPRDRVRELGDASVPFEFDIHALIPYEDAPALEHALHRRFVHAQVNKVNPRKEFFRVSLDEIRTEIERLRIAAQWTLTAECREWRESQAIEQALAAGTVDRAAWAESQLKAPSVVLGEEVEEMEEVA